MQWLIDKEGSGCGRVTRVDKLREEKKSSRQWSGTRPEEQK